MILPQVLALALVEGAIGLPPWPLAPDGERVVVPLGLELTADGAAVRRESDREWVVTPEAGREAVHLRAGGDTATAPVAPPPGTIQLAFDPPAPVKGRDGTVRLLIEAHDRSGAPLGGGTLPVLRASCGTLGPVTAGDAPGRFVATWQPSESPQPEVLGVVAVVPRCPLCATPLASGVGRLPVSAAIELPGRSDPGVLTRVEIAGQSWGPVRADADGRFALPVVVPPGTRWAQASSRSALGNERRTRIDLHLPEGPGLHCAAWPERVPADGETLAGLLCVGWTATGGALELASLGATAGRGAISGSSPAGGAWRGRYRPPRGGAGEDRLAFSWEGRGTSSRAQLSIGLAPGAPASITWRVEGEPVVPGERVRFTAKVLDAYGDPLGEATADGRAAEGGTLRARAELGDGVQRVALRWGQAAGDAPATLAVGRVGDQWVAIARDVARRPVAGVALRFGSGARVATDSRGEARVAARGPTETVDGPAGLRAAGWIDVPPPPSPIAIEGEGRIALRPPGTVDVEARVDGGWIRWLVRGADGGTLAGRAVDVTSETVELGAVERDGDGGRCAIRRGKGSVAVEDRETGAAAIVEAR